MSDGIKDNVIKLKADRLYKRLVGGGLILACVSTSVFRVGERNINNDKLN